MAGLGAIAFFSELLGVSLSFRCLLVKRLPIADTATDELWPGRDCDAWGELLW